MDKENMPKRCNTKIVATIADMNCDVEFLRELYQAGMTVVRINSAHASFEGAMKIVRNTRAVSDRIAILIDTKGPEIRTSKCEDSAGIPVATGEHLIVKGGTNESISNRECLYVNDLSIVKDVPVGASLLIDDGDIKLDVVDKTEDSLITVVQNRGVIKNFKSVNVPDVPISLPSITERDKAFILWAIENDLDFIAHSFVRSAQDVKAVQSILDEHGSTIKIISKIENREGVDNIDEILKHTYGVMVARGDLGVEIPAEQIPRIQRMIVSKCVEFKRPVIIATQLLQSMIKNPRPTRAEVSDVANAIYQRTDAIMLSGETANGDYPVEAVKTMRTVAYEVESSLNPITGIELRNVKNKITELLAKSAVAASIELPVKAIIIDTMSGRTGRYFSAFRSPKPVYAVCYKKHIMRAMSLSYGVEPIFQDKKTNHSDFLFEILSRVEAKGLLKGEDLVAVVAGDFGAAYGPTFMEISQLTRLKNKHLY